MDRSPPRAAAAIWLVVPLQHVQHERAQCTFEFVELFAPQRLDLLGKIFAVKRCPPAGANVARLLHEPRIEVAIVVHRYRSVGRARSTTCSVGGLAIAFTSAANWQKPPRESHR